MGPTAGAPPAVREALFQAIEYRETGNTNLQPFFDSMLAAVRTPSAQRIAKHAVNTNSQRWQV